MTLHVEASGALALVQDAGRPGLARLGVGAAGAMDRAAFSLANRLVGNPSDVAAIELLLGGMRLRFVRRTWFAVTGAWGEVTLDGARVEPHTATLAAPGAILALGAAEHGIRYYVAVRGGIAVPPALGSRSRDTLAGLGPLALSAGDLLPLGPEPVDPIPSVDVVPIDPPSAATAELELLPGPRRDWFTDGAWQRMLGDWSVSARSDRTGIRLEGPALDRIVDGELASEGMVHGGIQVSPDGAPTVLGPDHPVTGGYPVIGVVTDASLDALAQLRPGQRVRFRAVAAR